MLKEVPTNTQQQEKTEMTTMTAYAVTARERTDDERAEAGAVARTLQKRVHTALYKGRLALWELTEALYEWDESSGWLDLGYEKLSHWLAEPEHAMSRTHYYRLVRTWRKLVIERQIDADRLRLLDQSKVALVTDAIAANRVTLDEALDDARDLGARDLRIKYLGEPEPETVPTLAQSEPEVEAHGTLSRELEAYAEELEADARAADDEVEVLTGVVVDPVDPLGPVMAYEIAEARAALPERVLELLDGKPMRDVREDLERATGSGAENPWLHRNTVLVLGALLDLLGAGDS